MTDKEALRAMLTRAGIRFEEEERLAVADPEGKGFTLLSVDRGYRGLFTTFEFSTEGALIEMGAYDDEVSR